MTSKILRFGSAASAWRRTPPSSSLGMTRLMVTIPALRLMNCLRVGIVGLLIQLELRQAHDLMDQFANSLVDGRIVIYKLDRLSLIVGLQIARQPLDGFSIHVERPQEMQKVV